MTLLASGPPVMSCPASSGGRGGPRDVRLDARRPVADLARDIADAHALHPGHKVSTFVFSEPEPREEFDGDFARLFAQALSSPVSQTKPPRSYENEMEDISREFALLDGIEGFLLAQRDRLTKFAALPRCWQETLLISVGGTGAESDDLIRSPGRLKRRPPLIGCTGPFTAGTPTNTAGRSHCHGRKRSSTIPALGMPSMLIIPPKTNGATVCNFRRSPSRSFRGSKAWTTSRLTTSASSTPVTMVCLTKRSALYSIAEA